MLRAVSGGFFGGSARARRKRRLLWALAVLVAPLVCITLAGGAEDNVHLPWGYQQLNIGPLAPWEFNFDMMEPLIASSLDRNTANANLVQVGQFGQDNRVTIFQVGFDDIARVIQAGLSNVVVGVQDGYEHRVLVGQFGSENSAFTWQEKNTTAIVLLQLGDQNAVTLWPGVGLRINIMQLGK